jgi:hypothetical protein
LRGRGGFPIVQKEVNHPVCGRFGGCASFLLMPHPPLLAVMQGGDYGLHSSHADFFDNTEFAEEIRMSERSGLH